MVLKAMVPVSDWQKICRLLNKTNKETSMRKKTRIAILSLSFFCYGCCCLTGCVPRVPLSEGNAANDKLNIISKAEFEKLYLPPQVLAAKKQKAGQGPLIYPGDELAIGIYDKLPASQEMRTERKRVGVDGTVFLVPIKQVTIGGLTVAEAEKEIENKLTEFVVSPFVEIEVMKRAYEPEIYVFGETGKNGIFKIREGYRLLDAIAESGGYTGNAYRRSVKIIRIVDQKIVMISIDVSTIFNDAKLSNNVLLQDQDILFVPRRLVTDIAEVLNSVSPFVPWYYFIKNF
jgi:protein involved in polysaccharide export with SLBB domain